MALWLLVAVASFYVAFLAIAWAAQGRLIYPAPPARSLVPPGFERISYTTPDGLDLTAGYLPARDGPTLLFFHGNGADWQSTAMVTDRLAAAGAGVLAAEYRGYAGNAGSPSEEGFYADGRAAYDHLVASGVPPSEIVIVGNSIGSGVAVQLASEVDAAALVLISPFDSLTDTAARQIRWAPVRLLLRDRYDNAGKIGAIAMPILILHGAADTLIGVDQAERLARQNRGSELIIYPDWGHDLVVNPDVQRRIAAFIEPLG